MSDANFAYGRNTNAPRNPPATAIRRRLALGVFFEKLHSVANGQNGLGGVVGVPSALGGRNQLGEWLAPSFQTAAAPAASTEGEAAGEEGDLEFTLMTVSSFNAVQGHSTSNVTSITQKAAVAALSGPQDGVTMMLNEYRKRRQKKRAEGLEDGLISSHIVDDLTKVIFERLTSGQKEQLLAEAPEDQRR